jgi:hypothetical protein
VRHFRSIKRQRSVPPSLAINSPKPLFNQLSYQIKEANEIIFCQLPLRQPKHSEDAARILELSRRLKFLDCEFLDGFRPKNYELKVRNGAPSLADNDNGTPDHTKGQIWAF